MEQECALCRPLLMDIRASAKAEEGLRFLASQINPMTIVLKSLNIHEVSRKETKTGVFWVIVSGCTQAEEARLRTNFEPVARRLSMDIVFWTYGMDRHGNLYIMAAIRNTIQYNQPTEQTLVRTAILVSILEAGGGGQIPEDDVRRALVVVFRNRIQRDMNIMLLLSQISYLHMNDQTKRLVVGGECIHVLANSADLQFNCFVKSFWDMFLVKAKTPEAKLHILQRYEPADPPHNQDAFIGTRGLFRPCVDEIRMYLASFTIDDILVGDSVEIPSMVFSLIVRFDGDKALVDALWMKMLASLETLSHAVHDIVITCLDDKVVQLCIAMVTPTRTSAAAQLVGEFLLKLNNESIKGSKKQDDAPIRTLAFTPFPPCGRAVLMECLRCNKAFKMKDTFENLNSKASAGHVKPGYAHMLDLRKKDNPERYQGDTGAHRFFKARALPLEKKRVSTGEPGCDSREHLAVMGMLSLKGSDGMLEEGHAKRQRLDTPSAIVVEGAPAPAPVPVPAPAPVPDPVPDPAPAPAPAAAIGDGGSVEITGDGGMTGDGGTTGGGPVIVDDKWAVAKQEIKAKFLAGVSASALAATNALTIMKKILDKVGEEGPGNTGIDIQQEIDAACNQLKLSFETLHQSGTVGIAMEALSSIP